MGVAFVSMLYIMVPATLALAVTALVAFVWAVKTGQFDDPQSHAYRMLFEDEPRDESQAEQAHLKGKASGKQSDED